MKFTVQHKASRRGAWKPVQMSAHHSELRSALERILSCDPDRFFDPSMRVVDEAGEVVLDLAIWRECMAAGRSLPEGHQ